MDLTVVFLVGWFAFRLYETFAPNRNRTKGAVSVPWTLRMLIASWIVGLLAMIGEHLVAHREVARWVLALGVGIVAARTALKWWAMRTLGRFWSIQVELRPDQALCQEGPYRWVRHPAYLATLSELVGMALIAGSWWGLAYALVVHQLLIRVRIHFEERELRQKFGPVFERYQATTRAFLPRVGLLWDSRAVEVSR